MPNMLNVYSSQVKTSLKSIKIPLYSIPNDMSKMCLVKVPIVLLLMNFNTYKMYIKIVG